MQSASPVQLAPRHVEVTIAESSFSTSNGGMNAKPRVKARAGRLLRSIHSVANLKRASRRSLTTTSPIQLSRNMLIHITRPLGIEGKGIGKNRRFKLDRNRQTRSPYYFIISEWSLRIRRLSGASCAGINACLSNLKRSRRADSVLRWVVKHVTLGQRRRNVLCHQAQFSCY